MTANKLCFDLYNEMMHFIDRIDRILEDHKLDNEDTVYVKFFFMSMNASDVMLHAIDKILPWKENIHTRNDKFFYDNKEIFGKLPQDKVSYFSNHWKKTFNDEDKLEIWAFFDVFITFAEEYNKCIESKHN